jgi:transposase InsO family protein
MSNDQRVCARLAWARLRFSIIGPLLASPPERGELRRRLEELASKTWRHPTTGESVRFSLPTLERWFYQARSATDDPVAALERKVPAHAGTRPSVGEPLRQAIHLQYRQHPRWSYQLHYDNLLALAERDSSLGPVPSYGTLCRFMKEQGLVKQRRRRRKGQVADDPDFAPREMRSFEVRHVHGLWHADYHVGSRKVLNPTGEWRTPVLLGFLDDRSRLACHLQWYLSETAETFVHGLCQAILKRGLPRSLLTDNGNPMTAAETQQGLERLGITHWTTLPYTPEQNAKQEKFWGQVEGRLLAMLEGERELTLPLLNQATQAWFELEYNRRRHSELGDSPLDRFLAGPDLGRPSPSSEELRRAFRMEVRRQQRRTDGTITIDGKRFELPSRYRVLSRPTLRYARWDLSTVDLVDPRSGRHLCTLLPLDKERNADRRRSTLEPVITELAPRPPAGVAPRLQQLMADYSATGLPPAYLPHDSEAPASESPDPHPSESIHDEVKP